MKLHLTLLRFHNLTKTSSIFLSVRNVIPIAMSQHQKNHSTYLQVGLIVLGRNYVETYKKNEKNS